MLSLTSLRDCYNTGKGMEGERMEGEEGNGGGREEEIEVEQKAGACAPKRI